MSDLIKKQEVLKLIDTFNWDFKNSLAYYQGENWGNDKENKKAESIYFNTFANLMLLREKIEDLE